MSIEVGLDWVEIQKTARIGKNEWEEIERAEKLAQEKRIEYEKIRKRQENFKDWLCAVDTQERRCLEKLTMDRDSNSWIGKIYSLLRTVVNAQEQDNAHDFTEDFYEKHPELQWICQMLLSDGFVRRVSVNKAGDFPYRVTTKGLALYMVVSDLWLRPEKIEKMDPMIFTAITENNALKFLAALVGQPQVNTIANGQFDV